MILSREEIAQLRELEEARTPPIDSRGKPSTLWTDGAHICAGSRYEPGTIQIAQAETAADAAYLTACANVIARLLAEAAPEPRTPFLFYCLPEKCPRCGGMPTAYPMAPRFAQIARCAPCDAIWPIGDATAQKFEELMAAREAAGPVDPIGVGLERSAGEALSRRRLEAASVYPGEFVVQAGVHVVFHSPDLGEAFVHYRAAIEALVPDAAPAAIDGAPEKGDPGP